MERQTVTKAQRKPSRNERLQKQAIRAPIARHPLMDLQRSIGNQAVQRLIRSQYIQAKLQVNEPDDKFEREADQMADKVMRMPDHLTNPEAMVSNRTQISRIHRKCLECEGEVQRQPLEEEEEKEREEIAVPSNTNAVQTPVIQRLCTECSNELHKMPIEEEEQITEEVKVEGMVQRSTEDNADGQASDVVRAQIENLRGGGQPLPGSVRAYFEPRFGHDFGGVRLHTGAGAAKAARSINARAFTVGRDVAFGAGQYSPETSAGKRLLAHELTHTIQQGATPSAGRHASAQETSVQVSATPSSSSAPGIQRVCEVTPPPPMGCTEALGSAGSGTPILFSKDSPALSPADLSTLSAIAAAWHAGGGVQVLRIDGFASCDGPPNRNWLLSCSRTQAVALELEAPSDGSPGVDNAFIEVFANGETDQFSTTNLPPNRRAVITGGGAPPPGPSCRLTITGPDEVDHYCAAYVPSDAAACGVFPAPNIALTVAGAAPGATLTWSIARGSARASIVGANNGATVNIQGDAASGAQGDVTVHVTDGTCTTTHSLTVRQPSEMTAAQAPTVTPTFVQTIVTYTVRDQFGNPMGANICVDETVTLCRTSHPGTMTFGDAPTNAAGQVIDNLQIGPVASGIPAGFCRKFDQVLTAGGCGPLLHNTLTLQATGITLTFTSSCASGDPCP